MRMFAKCYASCYLVAVQMLIFCCAVQKSVDILGDDVRGGGLKVSPRTASSCLKLKCKAVVILKFYGANFMFTYY